MTSEACHLPPTTLERPPHLRGVAAGTAYVEGACFTVRVRHTEFWRLMEDEFGPARARMLADHHALSALGSVSAAVALERGEEPRRVWQALCAEMDVPPERWFGKDRPVRRG